MNSLRQIRLVALREIRERARSRAFQISLLVMVLAVVAAVALPSFFDTTGGTKDVGLTGTIPEGLAMEIAAQSEAAGASVRITRYDALSEGEEAVRNGDIDVLVVDGRQLEWRRQTDKPLESVLAASIQFVAIRERATTAGMSSEDLHSLIAPVSILNVELGSGAGATSDDEAAGLLMTIALFVTIATYGNLVLAGVVEEKASRVVEVLLARMPARNLLAGKVAGIGILGLAQVAVTALAALVASNLVESFDVPAVRSDVLAWVVVWFVLGYALYAMVYGALGSLASRSEDAQSVAGPVQVLLVLGYFLSFASIGSPDAGWSRAIALFPATAPFAMPGRIAIGAASWWEPILAVVLTLVTIVGLVELGGRVYEGAILRNGPALRLMDVMRDLSAGARKTAAHDHR